jgi:ribose transport system substrate-binding protein
VHRTKKWLACGVLVVIAMMAVVGCGSGGSSTGTESTATESTTTESSGGSGESGSGGETAWLSEAETAADQAAAFPTTIPTTELGPFKPKPEGSIYHVACNQALTGCARFAEALKAASGALGYKFQLCDGGTTTQTIAKCFTNAVNAKPSAIVVNGIGDEEAQEGYEAAAAANIPIVGSLTGNAPGGVKGVVTEVNGSTCENEGKTIANWVMADSEGKANVLFVGTQTYKCNQQRQTGFLSAIEACTTCDVQTLEYSIESISTTLPQQIQSKLQSDSSIEYVIATPDAAALSAVQAVRQSGKSESVKVAGFDGDAPNVALVKSGEIDAAETATGFGQDGWIAADAAARAIAGQKVPKDSPDTILLITNKNAGEIEGSQYQGVPNYEEQFEKLWE